MGDLRILVVEDAENWQQHLPKVLRRLGGTVQVDVAGSYAEGRQLVLNHRYDLAVVDLALRSSMEEEVNSTEVAHGMEMLHELRNNRRNNGCGLIVLTAYATAARTRQALKDYTADEFLEKDEFNDTVFLDSVRNAIFAARLRQSRIRANAQYRLTLTFDRERLLASNLSGPDRRGSYISPNPARIDITELTRRGDNLNLLIRKGGPDIWRPEARSIGDAIHTALASEQRILGDLIVARALGERFSELWLQFEGPSTGLGVPFELLRDEGNYLAFDHIITRKLAGSITSRKPETFDRFLENLHRAEQRLRILVIGANSDGQIPGAETEATALAIAMEADLQQLGIAYEITLLKGTDANYDAVQEALRTGGFHLLHYAGHGYFDTNTAEHSGLVLRSANNVRVLTAATLNLLMRGSELRMVFLSCCVGARTANEVGRGDFAGMMEAIARADVPIVLGYRWEVADTPAVLLAMTFYQTLWHTFTPGYALREARRTVAMGRKGLADETWAAPVLLMQNE